MDTMPTTVLAASALLHARHVSTTARAQDAKMGHSCPSSPKATGRPLTAGSAGLATRTASLAKTRLATVSHAIATTDSTVQFALAGMLWALCMFSTSASPSSCKKAASSTSSTS